MIEEVRGKVGLGSTDPIHCVVEGERFVAKWQYCEQEHYSLINEFIGYEICKLLLIKLPDHEFVTISEKGLESNNTEFSFEVGHVFFASKYIEKTAPLTSGMQLKTVEHKEILKMIFIDILLCNKDRNKGNILLHKSKSTPNVIVYPIDYTHAFHLGCTWPGGFFKSVLNLPECLDDISQYLLDHQGYQIILSTLTFTEESIEHLCQEMKMLLKKIDLVDIFSRIPLELKKICEEEDFEDFIDFLRLRFASVDNIKEALVDLLCKPKIISSGEEG